MFFRGGRKVAIALNTSRIMTTMKASRDRMKIGYPNFWGAMSEPTCHCHILLTLCATAASFGVISSSEWFCMGLHRMILVL